MQGQTHLPTPCPRRSREGRSSRLRTELMSRERTRQRSAQVARPLFLTVGVVFLMAMPSLAFGQPSYIQPDDGGSILAKPRAFRWTGYGASGNAFGVRWRRWGRQNTVARGRINICWSMGIGCRRNLAVRIRADSRRDLSFSGAHEYIYCHLVFCGNLDPQNPGRRLSMTLPTPNACRRT